MMDTTPPEPVEVEIVGATVRPHKVRLRSALQAQSYLERAVTRYDAGEIEAKELWLLAHVLVAAVKLQERAEHEREIRLLDKACLSESEMPRLTLVEAV